MNRAQHSAEPVGAEWTHEKPCPRCGGDNPVAGAFCGHCGSAFADLDVTAEVPSAEITLISEVPTKELGLRPDVIDDGGQFECTQISNTGRHSNVGPTEIPTDAGVPDPVYSDTQVTLGPVAARPFGSATGLRIAVLGRSLSAVDADPEAEHLLQNGELFDVGVREDWRPATFTAVQRGLRVDDMGGVRPIRLLKYRRANGEGVFDPVHVGRIIPLGTVVQLGEMFVRVEAR